jgi:hypothetical protein
MRAAIQVEVRAVSESEGTVLFETTTTAPMQRRSLLALAVTQDELRQFQEVLNHRPFGNTEPHRVWLQYLKQAGGYSCGLRVSVGGGRKEFQVAVSSNTFAGLEYVFNQFALDPELVPERPECVSQRDA